MKKKLIVIAVILVIGSIIAFIKISQSNNFSYAGTVEATEVDLSARITGVISDVFVQEGDEVKKDSVLVKISAEDIDVAAAAAERDFKRASELLNAGSLNKEAYDKFKFKKDDTAVRLGWAVIKSPLDGTVITRYHEPGELVNPGTKLLTLADLDNVWAYIYVEQPAVSKISIGMKVDGTVPEAPGKIIPGKIVHMNAEAEFTPKNIQTRKERTRLVFGVKIAFENKDRFLKPGMTVEVKLPEK
jgi:HlyD family secretion protein